MNDVHQDLRSTELGAVDMVSRVEFVPTVLRLIQEHTGMHWSAVARVTDDSWTACAVVDQVGLGLEPGSQIDIDTTLCREVKRTRTPIAISHAATDPVYANHVCPRVYKFESYVSVPIVLPGGAYFGNLCALDPEPRDVSGTKTLSMLEAYASLIASYLDLERQRDVAQDAVLKTLRSR